ncbi:similar to UDP-sugar transporter [Cyanidioschyzon merolae strain 10D]|jgi:solute carrier family 35 protein|uniref:Similar to UDP-sugar transporter n=1 Tax=Cyanidioschyzon merolae (strain NIES-3377 / 10D) TaxID=280699 RepID=M1V5X7_CYAM1|nr:similar to UDP-sugar transporter [Cyanidioschyzon merolae strain 10D]BAM81440.1 similar to UDP-sugar transporter [Cyanidioschyzon merolae strain 10D]|eukprot:XP_005537476.1 similar to UDP-sugar transporter [Cyanidioschyzon merolae strain 10D]
MKAAAQNFTPNGANGGRTSLFRAVLAMAYYITAASGLTILNKSIFSSFGFRYPLVLVEAQLLCTLGLFELLTRCHALQRPTWSFASASKMLPLVGSYLVMLLSGMFGLQNTTLVIYNTLRRTTVAFVLVLEYFILNVFPTLPTLCCVLAMTLGATWAGLVDSTFDLYGYVMIFVANVSSALYVVYARQVKQTSAWSNTDILYLNSLFSAPLVLGFVLWRGELTQLYRMGIGAYPWSFYLIFALACLMGFIINHSIFYNTNTNSPLTQTISAQVKDVILLVASAPFDGTKAISENLVGILISLLGSVAYSIIKYREHRALTEERH